MNPTKNNWILEEPEMRSAMIAFDSTLWVQEKGILELSRYMGNPVFDQVSKQFWTEYFTGRLEESPLNLDMKKFARDLDLVHSWNVSFNTCVTRLVSYFNDNYVTTWRKDVSS